MKKTLVLVSQPDKMHPFLAQFCVLEGDHAILVTDPSQVTGLYDRCDRAVGFYCIGVHEDADKSWQGTEEVRNALSSFSDNEVRAFKPWAHISGKAIESEALLMERLEDVLPEVIGGTQILEELREKHNTIFAFA